MTEMDQKITFPCPIGMVFGVFDYFHPGHEHFLREAGKHCHQLIVVVAHPQAVATIKGRRPRQTEEERLKAIAVAFPQATTVLGDPELGTWTPLKEYHPDCVFLGYDQASLGETLAHLGQVTHPLSPHEPHRYKSSLMAGSAAPSPS